MFLNILLSPVGFLALLVLATLVLVVHELIVTSRREAAPTPAFDWAAHEAAEPAEVAATACETAVAQYLETRAIPAHGSQHFLSESAPMLIWRLQWVGSHPFEIMAQALPHKDFR